MRIRVCTELRMRIVVDFILRESQLDRGAVVV